MNEISVNEVTENVCPELYTYNKSSFLRSFCLQDFPSYMISSAFRKLSNKNNDENS